MSSQPVLGSSFSPAPFHSVSSTLSHPYRGERVAPVSSKLHHCELTTFTTSVGLRTRLDVKVDTHDLLRRRCKARRIVWYRAVISVRTGEVRSAASLHEKKQPVHTYAASLMSSISFQFSRSQSARILCREVHTCGIRWLPLCTTKALSRVRIRQL
jgi:hypothetical protein